MNNNFNLLILFGSTGDLTKKKLIPGIYKLFVDKKINESNIRILAIGRKDYKNNGYSKFLKDSLTEFGITNIDAKFYNLFSYFLGDLNSSKTYLDLKNTIQEFDLNNNICSNKILYFAVQPDKYITIVKNIKKIDLLKTCNALVTKAIIEKPFGLNLNDFIKLDLLLKQQFKEEQIYRIDHYLGKDIFLKFIELENDLNKYLNPSIIESVFISTAETLDINNRGAFYNQVGALRDVGQNHLLELVALVILKSDFLNATKRSEIFKSLIKLNTNNIPNNTFRAQFKDFNKINGVDLNSKTETYFKIQFYLNDNWNNVKFIIEAGKMLGLNRSFIEINYKDKSKLYINFLRGNQFIKLFNKNNVTTFYEDLDNALQYANEYANLILGAIENKRNLFIDFLEAKYQWEFIDPIVNAWQNNLVPLFTYKPNDKSILNVSTI